MTIDDFEALYALSWSPSQQCFHIEQLGSMLSANIRIYLDNEPVDFIPVGFAATHAEVVDIRKKLEESREMRENKKT